MENVHIAGVFDDIADLLALQNGSAFRIRAYRNAARTVRDHPRRIADLVAQGSDLSALPNIGDSTAQKIREIVATGSCRRLQELAAQVPPELAELLRIPQLGPRKVMQLHEALGIRTVDELERACRAGRVRKLKGMGPKTEQQILAGIELLRRTAARLPLAQADGVVAALVQHLQGCPAILRAEIAGSFRRRRESVGDLDVVVEAREREAASAQLLTYRDVAEVLSRGRERLSVRLQSGLQVDFRFSEDAGFGAALCYFTGSRAHVVRLRRLAQERGWKLNEYGLFSGQRRLAGRSEESLYAKLGLPCIAPELREERGELEAAAAGALPRLIEQRDIRGDLQCHTTATDGRHTIREMAEAARARGYEYLAITDHSKRVRMAGGLNDDQALRHADEIRRVGAQLDGFWLLAGIEVDILRTGALDLEHKTLEQLDFVLASMHYDLHLERKQLTQRLLAAIRSGVVHAIAHPLSRMLGKRDAIAIDLDAVLDACVEHGVRLEINASPDRLDLPDTACQRALQAGVGLVINTDAHAVAELGFMGYGVDVARRGWARKQDVLNARTAKQLARLLRRG